MCYLCIINNAIKNENMKKQDLPECGRDVIFELPSGSVYGGV